VADRFLSAGQTFQIAPFGQATLDLSDLPSRHNYYLALRQEQIERLLAEWVCALSVPIYRGHEVTAIAQNDADVAIQLSRGAELRAEYLVGCDGGRSVVRKQAGIDFPGWDASTSYLIAEASVSEEPQWGFRRSEQGNNGIGKLGDGNRVRIVLCERHLGTKGEPTLNDVREGLVAIYGTHFGLHDATWISRFTDMARQAAAYRNRRVLLAGDAAHVHSPIGGQGLNIGVQDAVNLGWKLAQVVKGTSPASLLDSYHAERHPVGARAIRTTLALTALERGDDRSSALRGMVSDMMQLAEPRQRYNATLSGLDIRYDLGEGHPLLGRRMPDLDIVTDEGVKRVFTWLHGAEPVLLQLNGASALDVSPWTGRVKLVQARHDGAWELPVVGAIKAPSTVLIRPDGYVGWVAEGTDDGLRDALCRWCGPPQ
jgi:2-polyprenyl-6-methoxyphenol hydroxylase-like FAD-dependent oxidoreductase